MSQTASFEAAAQMYKYKELTERHGPQQVLIDFINFDKSLGSEIGLEGFETFSTQAQHELLLAQFNPDVMFESACEGFKTFLYGSNEKLKKRLDALQHQDDLYAPKHDADTSSSSESFASYDYVKKMIETAAKVFDNQNKLIFKIPLKLTSDKWGPIVEANGDDDKFFDGIRGIVEKMNQYQPPKVTIEGGGWTRPKLAQLVIIYEREKTEMFRVIDARRMRMDMFYHQLEQMERNHHTLSAEDKAYFGAIYHIVTVLGRYEDFAFHYMNVAYRKLHAVLDFFEK